MTEAELQDAVVELAHLFGWSVAHFRAARTAHGWRTACQYDAAGFPDLVLVRERIAFAELKSARGKSARGTMSVAQIAWLERLAKTGAETHVWTPSEWADGTIEAELRRRAA